MSISLSAARWGNQTVSVFGGQKGQFCSIPGALWLMVLQETSNRWEHTGDSDSPGAVGCKTFLMKTSQLDPFQLANKWVLRQFNESTEENFTNAQRWLWLCQRQRSPPASGRWWKDRSFGLLHSVASKAALHFVQPFNTTGKEVKLFLSV